MRLSGLALLVSAVALLAVLAFPVERSALDAASGISTASVGNSDGVAVILGADEVLTVRDCGRMLDPKSGSRLTHAYLDSIDNGRNMTGLAGSRAGGRGASPGIASTEV